MRIVFSGRWRDTLRGGGGPEQVRRERARGSSAPRSSHTRSSSPGPRRTRTPRTCSSSPTRTLRCATSRTGRNTAPTANPTPAGKRLAVTDPPAKDCAFHRRRRRRQNEGVQRPQFRFAGAGGRGPGEARRTCQPFAGRGHGPRVNDGVHSIGELDEGFHRDTLSAPDGTHNRGAVIFP